MEVEAIEESLKAKCLHCDGTGTIQHSYCIACVGTGERYYSDLRADTDEWNSALDKCQENERDGIKKPWKISPK